jgi:hypothetical protein
VPEVVEAKANPGVALLGIQYILGALHADKNNLQNLKL